MMKTIEISDDVYDHLLKNAHLIGEDASSILRRLLRLPSSSGGIPGDARRSKQYEWGEGAIAECLANPRFRVERDAVGKFLFVLGWLHEKHGEKFGRVVELRGRKRKYFARSADELDQSGESVNPQKIPNSNFWVVTNNDTPKKRRILADVMRLLGYGPADVDEAVADLE